MKEILKGFWKGFKKGWSQGGIVNLLLRQPKCGCTGCDCETSK